MADRIFGWRRVALVLASASNAELLEYLGVPAVDTATRLWARQLLDQVESFYEVYETDPDGGAAASAIEATLAGLVGPNVFMALREGAQLISGPIDGDLDDWLKALWILRLQDDPEVHLPRHQLRDQLRTRVMRTVDAVGDPGWARVPQPSTDDWERSFEQRHHTSPEDVAFNWAELRWTREIVSRLATELEPRDRAEFEAWAQAEMYSDPRPSAWPPAPRLSLEDAARGPDDSA